MERETVIIPEQKEKINKIKRKYKNMEMSDQTANKIHSLEATNKILKGAMILSGVLTAIDIFIPDPAPLLDEAVLTGITVLLNSASKVVDNKIDDLAKTGNTTLTQSEITSLGDKLINVARTTKNNRRSNGL